MSPNNLDQLLVPEEKLRSLIFSVASHGKSPCIPLKGKPTAEMNHSIFNLYAW